MGMSGRGSLTDDVLVVAAVDALPADKTELVLGEEFSIARWALPPQSGCTSSRHMTGSALPLNQNLKRDGIIFGDRYECSFPLGIVRMKKGPALNTSKK